MAKRGNGLGGTPVEIPRTGRANTWGVRTPLHFNKATGKRERHWIGREYKDKTAAERALRVWITDYEAGKVAALSGVLGAAVPKLIPVNPAATAHPPTARQIRAQESKYPPLDDGQTTRFLGTVWEPCGNRACDGGFDPPLPSGRSAVDRVRRYRRAPQ